MKKYWIALLVGALLGLGGCECLTCGGGRAVPTYPVQGINAYQGQSAKALLAANGAPNQVQQLADGGLIWTYFTSYTPVGRGELITYNGQPAGASGMTCSVKVAIYRDVVQAVQSTC